MRHDPATSLTASLDSPHPELREAARRILLRAMRSCDTVTELAEALQVSERTAKRLRARFRFSPGPPAVLLENA